MMPRRIAETDPFTQITDPTGSGPFIFQRALWRPGHLAVYVRNPDYTPRAEPPSRLAGGKRALVDRIEWLAMPDHLQAINALQAGEIDFIEAPPFDLHALLKADPKIQLMTLSPVGSQNIFRLNHLHKPFDDPMVRRALWHAFNQEDFLKAVIGDPDKYKTCKALFICGTPYASDKGTAGLLESNFDKSRALLKEAGYDGTPVVLLQSSDLFWQTNLAPVAKRLMEKGGFKVDMQPMDWQSIIIRTSKKSPPEQGGWHAYLISPSAMDLVDPVSNRYLNSVVRQGLQRLAVRSRDGKTARPLRPRDRSGQAEGDRRGSPAPRHRVDDLRAARRMAPGFRRAPQRLGIHFGRSDGVLERREEMKEADMGSALEGRAAIGRRDVLLAAGVGLVTSVPRLALAASPDQLTWGVHVSLAPTWFEPAEASGIITPFMVLYALHDAMVKPMPDQALAPSLAEFVTAAEDGRSYDFVLREGVRFHNGEPVTPADVKFSFERYRGVAHDLLQARVEAVETPDARHVRFRLKAPWPDFLTFYATATGAGWIVPKSYVEKVGDDGFKKAPIGAGPYKFVSFTPGVELVLEAFDQYWRKKPSVQRLVFKVIPDESTRLAALGRGEIDIAYSVRGELAEQLRKTPGLTLKPAVVQGTFCLYFPDQWNEKSPWHDVRVREAAGLAIDRQGTNEAFTLGYSDVNGNAIVPRGLRFLLAAAGAGLRPGQGQGSCSPRRGSRRASMPATISAIPRTPILPKAWSTTCSRSASAARCGPSSAPPSSRNTAKRNTRTSSRPAPAPSAMPRRASRLIWSRAACSPTAATPTSTRSTSSRPASSTARGARRSCSRSSS